MSQGVFWIVTLLVIVGLPQALEPDARQRAPGRREPLGESTFERWLNVRR
jgi:hypothetical protein